MINLGIPQSDSQLRPRITVIGVGGAGGNAVNNMIRANLEGVEFLVANTDAQALNSNLADRKIQLGAGVTQGLGAGSRPDIGRASAEEAMSELTAHLDGSHMVFITAGMGGGTGTGAAPVIARAAREMGMLTVGVVTKPFHFEGAHRMRMAESGLQELQEYVDTLIIIPNQNLFRIANEKTTFADAFKLADEVLHSGVRGVTDLMVMPGLINLDFADIRTVMAEMGKAMMGTGEAEGDRRSINAAEAAISNPLLDDVSMKGARGVLVSITGGLDITLYEVDEAVNRIRDEVDPEANIIFGSTFDESMEGKVRVSVVATGIDAVAHQMGRPAGLHTPHTPTERWSQPASEAPRPAPVQRPAAAPASPPPAAVRHDPVGEDDPMDLHDPEEYRKFLREETGAAEPAAKAGGNVMPMRSEPPRGQRQGDAFVAPAPVEAAKPPAQAAPQRAHANPYAEADLANARPAPPKPASQARPAAATADAGKRRSSNIFARMTRVLTQADEAEEPAPRQAPAPRPAAQARPPAPAPHAAPHPAASQSAAPQPAAQQQPATQQQPAAARPQAAPAPQGGGRLNASARQHSLNGLDGGRSALPSPDDDQLDIPAFLRRQAN